MRTDRSIRNLSRFLEAKFRQSLLEAELEARARVHPAITISRETGAGAVTIGQRVAELMQQLIQGDNWAVFDRELAAEVLKSHNLPERLAEYMTEAKQSEIKDFVGQVVGLHPPLWTLVEKSNETIRRLANNGNVILVGRGANCVTKNLSHVFHVRLVCPLDKRIGRVMATYEVDAVEARRLIEAKDRERREYVWHNFNRNIEDPLDYHMVINTGSTSDEEAAQIIAHAVSMQGVPGSI
jgi:hypothetical protein